MEVEHTLLLYHGSPSANDQVFFLYSFCKMLNAVVLLLPLAPFVFLGGGVFNTFILHANCHFCEEIRWHVGISAG